MFKYLTDTISEAYASLGAFIAGYIRSVIKLTFRPVVYAQFLLRRAARDKAPVGPFMFLFVTGTLFLAYFVRSDFDPKIAKDVIATSKPGPEIVAVVTVGFVMAVTSAIVIRCLQICSGFARSIHVAGAAKAFQSGWHKKLLRAKTPVPSAGFRKSEWPKRRWDGALYSAGIGWVFVVIIVVIAIWLLSRGALAQKFAGLMMPLVEDDWWTAPVFEIGGITMARLQFLPIPLLAFAFYPAAIQIFAPHRVARGTTILQKFCLFLGALTVTTVMLMIAVVSAWLVIWSLEKSEAPPALKMTSLYCQLEPDNTVTAYAIVDNQSAKDLVIGRTDLSLSVSVDDEFEHLDALVQNGAGPPTSIVVTPASEKSWFVMRSTEPLPTEILARLPGSGKAQCKVHTQMRLTENGPVDTFATLSGARNFEFTDGALLTRPGKIAN